MPMLIPGLLTYGLVYGLFFGVFGGGLGLLIGGLRKKQLDQTTYPGQKLSLSTRNFLFVSLRVGLIYGLFVGLIFVLPYVFDAESYDSMISDLFSAVIIGLPGGVIFGLFFGGFAIIQHYTLRFILARNNLLPWRLIPFLDHCVDLIFLHRVGGGYIFIHRLLMEHFAESNSDQSPPKKIHEVVQEVTKALSLRWKVGLLLLVILFVSVCGWITLPSLSIIYANRDQIAAQSGNAEVSMQYFKIAVAMKPNDAYYWNSYCWFGGLAGHAEEILPACEKAVNLAPGDGAARDSRGLARTLTGDYKGAIDDFKFFVEWTGTNKYYERDRVQRENWIIELEAGRNPIDDAILQELLLGQ